MIRKLKVYLQRFRHILQTEGLISLISRVATFLGHRIFWQDTYYIYKHILKERNERDFLPRLQNFTFEIVHNNHQADELAARGYEFRSPDGEDKYRLSKGAIAFCVFAKGELTHKGWVAMTEEAQKSILNLPLKIDFPAGEAFCGGTVTNPKYRQMGLMVYGYFKRLQFLREVRRSGAISYVAEDNVASHRAQAKLYPRLYAKVRYMRILGLIFEKELAC